MKELEDTKCEIRRSIELQLSIWDRSNNSTEEDGIPQVGSPGYNGNSTPLGNFIEDAAYAWLSCGSRLVVLNVKTGTSVSSWTFRYKVTCVSAFPTQPGQVPLLLVGLDNGASKIRDSSGLVCVFDCTTSQVLRAIRTPAGVEQLCVVTGGAEWEDFGDRSLSNFVRENSGMACVALRNLDHLIVHLRRTSWEGPEITQVADESNPAELVFLSYGETSSSYHKSSREKHEAYNLMNSRIENYIGFNRDEFESSSLYQESLTSSMIFSRKIGCLVSGCLGRIIIWQMDGAVRWVSPPMEENMSISHIALLEPTDDPRPFCYLWAAYQEETSRLPPVLRMYAILFERKYSDKGANVYFNLDGDPSLKFELELDDGNTVTSLCPIIRESNPEQTESGNKRGEDSLLLISLNVRTLIFDLNQWYKEQMPHTVGESQNPNVFLASYRTRNEQIQSYSEDATLDSSYLPSSLKEFPSNGSSPPEELFFPNSLSLEWINLSTGRLSFWMTRGLQAELLREMSAAGPVILIEPSETFNRCLSAGLIPNIAETSLNSDKDFQRETILSLCLEQRWSQFLLRCAKEWSDGSASHLFHAFLRWGMQRASSIKLTAHRLCIPLYDQSGSSVGEAEIKTLRFFAQQLECISNVVTNLFIDSIDLTKQRRALRRVSTYLQVLLWFYDVGLLPETQELEDDDTLPIGFSLKIPYPFERLATIYREKREQLRGKNSKNIVENEEDLFIDELVTRECPGLKSQWEREGGELSVGGNYPPSSLQSLLRSYLTDCYTPDSNEMENKHQITIYLLMDLAMLLQGSCPGVNQLIKYPSAFKLSPSLIKLTQALWLLDHEDYQGFLDMMTGQLVSDSDVKDWHHKLVLRTLIRNNQNKLALIYLRVRKPPLSSLEDQGTVISLSVEHGLVQSAFHRRPPSHYTQLLTRFFQACKIYGKLNDILHLALDPVEEEAFVKFLENEKSDDTRLLYYLQRCRYAEASTIYPMGMPSGRGHFNKSKQPASLTIFTAYNATLPEIMRKFTGNMTRRVPDIDSDSRYPRPMSHCKNRDKNREIHETVIRKAKETFLRGDRSQIPFISAPCSSLRPRVGNVDTNCVLFVERAKKPYGKRTLDDMHDEDEGIVGYNNGEERKRRKTSDVNDTPDNAGGKELGMSMVFDTPLVKRKNQMINARNTPVETPHSILKIRQMIRDSTSPGGLAPSSAEIAEEKERKPRQIRFSIGQQRTEEAVDDALENEEGVECMAQGDIAKETEKSINKASTEEEQEGDEESDAFFSPNVSSKSISETTLLTDSSYGNRNITLGPRPRPSLRRSNPSANDSSSDLLRKSLIKAKDASKKRSWTPTSFDSAKTSGDVSISSYDENNIVGIGFTQSPKARASLLSTSIYSTTVLSSNTSFDNTPVTNNEKKGSASREEISSSFVEQSVEKCRDLTGIHGAYERNDNFSKYSREISVKSVTRTSVREEYSEDAEDDNNSEIFMEVDGFGLDRDSDTRSRAELESNWESRDKRESFSLSTIQSVTIPEESQMETLKSDAERQEKWEKEGIEEEGNLEEHRDDWNKKQVSNDMENEEITENLEDTESLKPSNDYDDELMALKYEEEDEDDNEDAFQSLSNSMEIEEQSNAKKMPAMENSTTNNNFHVESKITSDELNITDDESSRSVDAPLTNESSSVNNELLEKTISVEKMGDDVSIITDDESNSTYNSSIFIDKQHKNTGIRHSSQTESERIVNEGDSSFDSSIFSSRLRNNKDLRRKSRVSKTDSEEINRSTSSLAETVASNVENELSERESDSREATPMKIGRQRSSRISKMSFDTPSKSKSPRMREEEAESVNVTPVRMTRSRRASSVAQELENSSLSQSPLVKSNAEKVGRLRRANSLVTDIFPSNSKKMSRTLSVGSESPVKKGGIRRSVSLAKEIFAGKALDESKKEGELPVRRSLRHATSAQREIPETLKTPVKVTRSSSKVSLVEGTGDEESVAGKKRTRSKRGASVSRENETTSTKKSTRGSSIVKEIAEENESIREKSETKRLTRGSSIVKEIPEENVNVPETSESKRLTRASSLSKEILEESQEISKSITRGGTRKRGSSVPKESEIMKRNPSQRVRRGSSVTKDIIHEESNEYVEESNKRKVSSGRTGDTKLESPATSTRSRLSSISSIAEEEEEEEIFSEASRGKTSEEKRTKSTRERRAVSVDSSQLEMKRRTRAGSIKRAISEDPIEEEPLEGKSIVETKTKGTRKTPTRRKRTVSATNVRDDEEETVVEKLTQRRTRKLSQRSNEGNDSFRFSPPDRAQDRPDDDQKEMDDVPNYVFSPPHTRSKHQTSIQPRREIKDFIPLTEKERNAVKRVARPRVANIVKTTKTMDLWGPHAVFVLPKRSNSKTN